MGVLTGTAQISPPVQAMFDRELLRRANPKLHHSRPALKKSLSRRNGNTMIFRRIPKLPLATTPLAEGIPPAGMQLSKTDVQCTIQQWGNFVPVTDLVDATVQHPVLRDLTKVLGENSGETIDALDRDVWVAGSSVFYGGAVSARASLTTTTHKVDPAILERVIRYLDQQNASMFTDMEEGTTKEGSTPIRECYWAITTPEVAFTLDSMAGWIAVEHYQGSTKVAKGERGAYKNIRFLVSSQAKSILGGGGSSSGDVKATSAVADVHFILIFGTDAVAEVPMEGMSLENIIKPIGSGGISDPLDQIGTSGWKHTGTRVRLNEAFMTRCEVTAGDAAP